ncbi:hypothetical protein BDW71DRAFT_215878 [Aspergillus fruticulosus]
MYFARKSLPFNPTEDIPSLHGKVVLVTGGTNGLGKQSILEYSKHNPALIWLAARNPAKAQAAIEEIESQLPRPIATNIKLLELDLSSFESVKKAASIVLAKCQRLDILMLNAGIMAVPPGLTANGHEVQFGTNYLGHVLLAMLLMPLLEKTATAIPRSDVRIILVSSHGHMYAPKPQGIRYQTLRANGHSLGPYERYGQSKLAMIVWAKEAARRYPRITVVSVHPGVVRTNLMDNATGSPCWVRVLGKVASKVVTSVEQGVRNQLWASVSVDVVSGCYYEPVGIGGLETEIAKDRNLARELWEWTEREIREHLG